MNEITIKSSIAAMCGANLTRNVLFITILKVGVKAD
jgi:hypothetical protein